MVEEMEKMVTKEGVENSSSINNAGGERSEAEEGEIVSGDLDDAEVKALAPPHPRHSLEHAWTLWFDNPSAKQKQATRGAPFALSTHFPQSKTSGALTTIYTILASWLWEQTFIVSKIKSSQMGRSCLFQRGKWTACFSRGKSDTSWLYTLLAMIGEQFDYGDEICGAVGSVRTKQEKIALWTKNAANEAAPAKHWKTMERVFGLQGCRRFHIP